MYNVQRSVCPPRLQENIVTVSAIDNLDYNPSSSTTKDSFHGTGVNIFQFQTNQDDSFRFELPKTSCNNYSPPSFPSYYTNVKPTKSAALTPRISTINSMNSMDADHFDESKDWFNCIHDHLCYIGAIGPPFLPAKCRTLAVNSSVMLPLLLDEVAAHGKVRHYVYYRPSS